MIDKHEPVFEMLEEEGPCGCEQPPQHIPCDGFHRIFLSAFTFNPGDFIYWDSTTSAYLPAVEGKCDLYVARIDPFRTWLAASNYGEFSIRNFTLKGPVYIDATGALTNTITATKVGFIENGHLYLNIQ